MRLVEGSRGVRPEAGTSPVFRSNRATALRLVKSPAHSQHALRQIGHERHRPRMQGRILSDAELFNLAKDEKVQAQAKVSGFRVGAAGVTESGRVLSAHNLEVTDRLAIGTCAESSIAFQLRDEELKALLITSDSEHCIAPCGGCRQTLAEVAPAGARIIMTGSNGDRIETTVGALLPMPTDLAAAASTSIYAAAIERAKDLYAKADIGGRKIAQHGAVVLDSDGLMHGGATRKGSGTMSLAVQMAVDARFLAGRTDAPAAVVIAGAGQGPHGLPIPTGRERQEIFNMGAKTLVVLVNPETGATATTTAEALLPFAYRR